MKRSIDGKTTLTTRSKSKTAAIAIGTSAAEDAVLGVEVVRSALTATPAPHINREQMIAETAYHHAEARGFEPGHELEDWLTAEAEVSARLCSEGCVY